MEPDAKRDPPSNGSRYDEGALWYGFCSPPTRRDAERSVPRTRQCVGFVLARLVLLSSAPVTPFVRQKGPPRFLDRRRPYHTC